MSRDVKVSIILVSYNTRELTIQTIHSIYANTVGVDFEIILVDNNSSDNTVSAVKETFSGVTCIENDVNAGFGSANNLGASYAKGEYLFLLNTDTILISNAVKILTDYMDLDSSKDVVAAGANLYDANKCPATSYSKIFPGILFAINEFMFNILHHIKKYNCCFNYSNSPLKLRGTISGADSMIRRECFNKVGGFDETFFLYYEETDLFYRLIKNGSCVASIPDAKIIHLEGGSEQAKQLTLERSFKSKYIYLNKHCKEWEIKILHFIYQMTCSTRIFCFGITGKTEKKTYWSMLKSVENKAYKIKRNQDEKI